MRLNRNLHAVEDVACIHINQISTKRKNKRNFLPGLKDTKEIEMVASEMRLKFNLHQSRDMSVTVSITELNDIVSISKQKNRPMVANGALTCCIFFVNCCLA